MKGPGAMFDTLDNSMNALAEIEAMAECLRLAVQSDEYSESRKCFDVITYMIERTSNEIYQMLNQAMKGEQ